MEENIGRLLMDWHRIVNASCNSMLFKVRQQFGTLKTSDDIQMKCMLGFWTDLRDSVKVC